jgi:hypothetical protein
MEMGTECYNSRRGEGVGFLGRELRDLVVGSGDGGVGDFEGRARNGNGDAMVCQLVALARDYLAEESQEMAPWIQTRNATSQNLP